MPKNRRKRLRYTPGRTIEQDALDLAQLIYDTYKESVSGGSIENGQNNAQQSSN